jgi:hypothetical protein
LLNAASVDPITLLTLTESSRSPVAAGVDTLGRWPAGDLQPGAEAVAEATELRNIAHTDAADPPPFGIAWHHFSQNTELPREYRAACPWG